MPTELKIEPKAGSTPERTVWTVTYTNGPFEQMFLIATYDRGTWIFEMQIKTRYKLATLQQAVYACLLERFTPARRLQKGEARLLRALTEYFQG